jgi:hypothetical protein
MDAWCGSDYRQGSHCAHLSHQPLIWLELEERKMRQAAAYNWSELAYTKTTTAEVF